MNPRSASDEKKFKKYESGKEFTEKVLEVLSNNISDKEFEDYSVFQKLLKKLIGNVEGMTSNRLNAIAMELSYIDKTAIVQKDKSGKVIYDTTTKDSEIIRLTQNVEEYFETEVYPFIPDAHYVYEFDENKKISTNNKEKLGAEFPFARYFYEYKEPESADELLQEFMEIEAQLIKRVKSL